MFDHSQTRRHQRVDGAVEARLVSGPGGARLQRLYQRGAAKAFYLPQPVSRPELVFLNTAGGLTGGDRLAYRLELGANAALVATTQTAERAYASLGPTAHLDVTMRVGRGSVLHWLPQETILFDRAALSRRTEIDLSPDASLLWVEMATLGRAAMGETVARLDFHDWRMIRRSGRPVLLDPVHLTDAVLARRDRGAVLGGARAMAVIALVARGAEARIDAARRLLESAESGVEAAASGWDGKLVIRALAPDLAPLRRLVVRVLSGIGGAPLPRVWQL